MSITLNAKGTSVPYFTIGKSGITMYQGVSDPHPTYTIKDGDYWFDRSINSIKVWSSVSASWEAPRLADLHFSSTSIVAGGGQDLTLSVDQNKNVVIDAGTSGPALITTTNNQDLHINPAVGGGQYLVLVANRWPGADGTNGQVLTTNGSGVMSWADAPGGTPSLTSTHVAYGSSSNLMTSSSNFTYDNTTSTLTVGDTGSPLISSTPGNSLTISADLSITLETNSLSRLVLNQSGSFTVAGSTGTAGQVLTSTGSSSSPVWATQNTIGSPAPATDSTTGFAYIPVTNGTPTSVPTTISGYAPMVADSSGNKLWIYIGGSWKSATLT